MSLKGTYVLDGGDVKFEITSVNDETGVLSGKVHHLIDGKWYEGTLQGHYRFHRPDPNQAAENSTAICIHAMRISDTTQIPSYHEGWSGFSSRHNNFPKLTLMGSRSEVTHDHQKSISMLHGAFFRSKS